VGIDVVRRASRVIVYDDVVAHDHDDYHVGMVECRSRALDVRVFRGFSITALEYIADLDRNRDGHNPIMTEEEAIDRLMRDHDVNGKYVMKVIGDASGIDDDDGIGRYHVPETYFVAIYDGNDRILNESLRRQNGIIGVVSAQPRRHSGSDDPHLPREHVYVANMKVDERMRRRGVGTALLTSVISWNNDKNDDSNEEMRSGGGSMNDGAETTTIAPPLVLSVDNDNEGAIRLYERLGFDCLERNEHFCVMILRAL
jgi:ribosomal protein S18 acetylase RimI-like enzyme